MKFKSLFRIFLLTLLACWGIFLKIYLINYTQTKINLNLSEFSDTIYQEAHYEKKTQTEKPKELSQLINKPIKSHLTNRKTLKLRSPLNHPTEYKKRKDKITIECLANPEFHKCYKTDIINNETMLNSLSTKEKIKQLLAPEYSYKVMNSTTPNTGYGAYVLMQTRAYKSSKQISNDIEQKLLTSDSIETEKIPPFIGVDAEGGIIQRFSWHNLNHLSDLKGFSQTEMNKALYTDMRTIKNSGFNWSLAPVVDLPYERNDWIHNRTISTDKTKIVSTSSKYITYMHNNKILTTLKHYPGHGDSQIDSHFNTPVINHNKTEWNKNEGWVFEQLIQSKEYSTVMTGHIKYPQIDNEITSVSEKWQSEILRNAMGFKGLIITDDISMLSTATDEACYNLSLEALKSGANIVIFVEGPKCNSEEMVKFLSKKYEGSEANKKILDQRVGEVLRFKQGWFR